MKVWWCEEHNEQWVEPWEACWRASDNEPKKPCRMVEMQLVPADLFALRLPDRELSKALLAKLDQAATDAFGGELLNAVWDVHEAGTLPVSIASLVRDWLAHAHFENDPVTQGRLAEVRKAQS